MRLLSFINSDISRLFSFSLFNLYNLLENPYSQFFVYMKALNLAVSGKVTEHVVPSFKKMDDFLSEWNLGTKDKRDLFLTVANILKDSKRWACLYVYACDAMRLKIQKLVAEFYNSFHDYTLSAQQKSLLTTSSSILKLFLVMMHWLWLKLRKKLFVLLLNLLSHLTCFR